MSKLNMKAKTAQNLQNTSITSLVNSSSTAKNIDRLSTDYLITRCEILRDDNSSRYDKCFKQHEELRMHLIATNEDYKYLRSWLENVYEDCLTMKSSHGNLIEIYEALLKNDNFVKDYVEYGVARKKVNLKFLSIMMQVKNVKNTLSVIDGDVTLLKSEYVELRRDVLLIFPSTEKSVEHAEREKELRIKSTNVMCECENLNTCLKKTYLEIFQLNSEYDNLTRNYRILSQNAVVREFLDFVKFDEEIPPESDKITKFDCSTSSISQHCNKDLAFSSLPQKKDLIKLDIEQQKREQIEENHSSLDNPADKSCNSLNKYQFLILPNETVEELKSNNHLTQTSSVTIDVKPFDTSVTEELPSHPVLENNFSKLKEENSEEMGFDVEEFLLCTSNSEEDDFVPESEKKLKKETEHVQVKHILKKCTSPRHYKCSFCHRTFKGFSNLKSHLRRVHSKEKTEKRQHC